MSAGAICSSQVCPLCVRTESTKVEDIVCNLCDSHLLVAFNCTTKNCSFFLCPDCFGQLETKKCPQCTEQTFQEHRVEWLSACLSPCKFDRQCPGHLSHDESSCKFDPELREKTAHAKSADEIPCALDPVRQSIGFERMFLQSFFNRLERPRLPSFQTHFARNIVLTVHDGCNCGSEHCISSLVYSTARFMSESLGFWDCSQCGRKDNRSIICSHCDAMPSEVASRQMYSIMSTLSLISTANASGSQERLYKALVQALNIINSISRQYEHLRFACEYCTIVTTDSSDRCRTCHMEFKTPLVIPKELSDIRGFVYQIERSLARFPNVRRNPDGTYSLDESARVESYASTDFRIPMDVLAMYRAATRAEASETVGESLRESNRAPRRASPRASSSYNDVVDISSSSSVEWTCGSCTFINTGQNRDCEICEYRR